MKWYVIYALVTLGIGIVSGLIYKNVKRAIGICCAGVSGWIICYIASFLLIGLYTLYLTYFPNPTGLEDVKNIVTFSAYVMFFLPILGYIAGITSGMLYLRRKDMRQKLIQSIDRS